MQGAAWWLRVAASAALLIAASACGESDDGGSSGGSAGQAGSGGTGAGGGSGADGGSGAGGGSSCCPGTAPTSGDACGGCEGASCSYLDCAVGKTEASCSAGVWNVSQAPCSPVDCGGTQCAPDQICVEKQGGALLYECADNPCGSSALECACAAAACPGTCMGVLGTTLTCNTCTSGICP